MSHQYLDVIPVVEEKEPALRAEISNRLIEARFRTIEEVYPLAVDLSCNFPDPNRTIIGLTELLINAVEHGNLELSYADKSRLGCYDVWQAETESRLADERYAHRWVDVRLECGESEVSVTIRDEGQGFDFQRYLEIDASRLLHTHGRGIAMARYLSFDTLEYRNGGREVVATVRIGESDHEAMPTRLNT